MHAVPATNRPFSKLLSGCETGKDLVAKGCYGPWRILLNVNPPRFPVCYSVQKFLPVVVLRPGMPNHDH